MRHSESRHVRVSGKSYWHSCAGFGLKFHFNSEAFTPNKDIKHPFKECTTSFKHTQPLVGKNDEGYDTTVDPVILPTVYIRTTLDPSTVFVTLSPTPSAAQKMTA